MHANGKGDAKAGQYGAGGGKEAADVNKDGVVDKLDYLAVLRDYYGYKKIVQ